MGRGLGSGTPDTRLLRPRRRLACVPLTFGRAARRGPPSSSEQGPGTEKMRWGVETCSLRPLHVRAGADWQSAGCEIRGARAEQAARDRRGSRSARGGRTGAWTHGIGWRWWWVW